jgi:hypothetical protein
MEIISRKDARAAGLTRYFTSKICKHGHLSSRLVSNRWCVACKKVAAKGESLVEQRERHHRNKQKMNEKCRIWREKNKEKIQKYKKDNFEKSREHRKRSHIKKMNDPIYALAKRVKSAISNSLGEIGLKKTSQTRIILGCSKSEFKIHIERQFTKGMTWENRDQWHIDHIIPISTAKTEADVIALNHFTNLRPLWAKDNIKKSNKMLYLI